MNAKAKKQIVVNVSEESKTKITELKDKLELTDKELVEVFLLLMDKTTDEVVSATIGEVTLEKKKAKIQAKIARIEAQLQKARGVLVTPTIEEEPEPEEVLYSAEYEEELSLSV